MALTKLELLGQELDANEARQKALLGAGQGPGSREFAELQVEHERLSEEFWSSAEPDEDLIPARKAPAAAAPVNVSDIDAIKAKTAELRMIADKKQVAATDAQAAARSLNGPRGRVAAAEAARLQAEALSAVQEAETFWDQAQMSYSINRWTEEKVAVEAKRRAVFGGTDRESIVLFELVIHYFIPAIVLLVCLLPSRARRAFLG